jgi:hypothetical protein
MSETPRYHGAVWGSLPPDFPTSVAERIYRAELDRMGASSEPARLMGMGFKGVAYRFRAAAEYDEEFSALFAAHGPGPGVRASLSAGESAVRVLRLRARRAGA